MGSISHMLHTCFLPHYYTSSGYLVRRTFILRLPAFKHVHRTPTTARSRDAAVRTARYAHIRLNTRLRILHRTRLVTLRTRVPTRIWFHALDAFTPFRSLPVVAVRLDESAYTTQPHTLLPVARTTLLHLPPSYLDTGSR